VRVLFHGAQVTFVSAILDATVLLDMTDLDTRDTPVAADTAVRLELISDSSSQGATGTLAFHLVSFAMRSFQHSESCVEYMLYCRDMAARNGGAEREEL